MPEQRRVRRVGNSWVIALPHVVREHLDVTHEGNLYWHLSAHREVVLTPNPRRIGGRPIVKEIERELDAARARIRELQARVRGKPSADYRELANQAIQQALRAMALPGGALFEIERALSDLRAQVKPRALRPRRRVEVAHAPVLGPEDNPPPNLSPLPPSGGAVASGAASPQATHA